MKITIAGNILVDKIKMIDSYPAEGMLSNIRNMSVAVGGCVTNTIIDLAKMQGDIQLSALGMVGCDDDGQYAIAQMTDNGIDVSGVLVDSNTTTSFTDVMTVKDNGNRTFFYNAGANNVFAPSDIVVDKLHCDIFHIGYLLLLPQFDRWDEQFGTAMARLLYSVQQRGIKTSIDMVSQQSDKYMSVVAPSLPYCNYVIINEIEAGAIVGVDARVDGLLQIDNVRDIMHRLIGMGVQDYVIVHAVEGGFAMNSNGDFYHVPSLQLPQQYIVGSVGAGDAFCAGCLYGIAKGFDADKILRYASIAAACNLSHADSISGMCTEQQIWQLEKQFPRR